MCSFRMMDDNLSHPPHASAIFHDTDPLNGMMAALVGSHHHHHKGSFFRLAGIDAVEECDASRLWGGGSCLWEWGVSNDLVLTVGDGVCVCVCVFCETV